MLRENELRVRRVLYAYGSVPSENEFFMLCGQADGWWLLPFGIAIREEYAHTSRRGEVDDGKRQEELEDGRAFGGGLWHEGAVSKQQSAFSGGGFAGAARGSEHLVATLQNRM